MRLRWREAMERALYGERGFFLSEGGPAGHFRTSVHASPAFADALRRLIGQVDEALGHPDQLNIVDVGTGRGELLAALGPSDRLRLTAVELAPRPADLPPSIDWRDTLPDRFTGVLVATEWLDNIPLDVVEVDSDGVARYVEVAPGGSETLGDAVTGADADWLARWWPLAEAPPGTRAEVGRTRDEAWAAAVSTVERGVALCVDYGHLASGRPPYGTLTGFRGGRQVQPVPDGSCDITAHVAMDSLGPGVLLDQRRALRALGVDGARPPLALASADPAGYVRALAAASAAAELTDPAGLGGHYWLLHPISLGTPRSPIPNPFPSIALPGSRFPSIALPGSRRSRSPVPVDHDLSSGKTDIPRRQPHDQRSGRRRAWHDAGHDRGLLGGAAG